MTWSVILYLALMYWLICVLSLCLAKKLLP